MTWLRSPEQGWTWHSDPSLVLGSSYPARVDTSTPDPDYRPRPVGFTAELEQPDQQGEPIEHVVARIPDHVNALKPRCPECRDADGHHFRSCPTQQGDPTWQ